MAFLEQVQARQRRSTRRSRRWSPRTGLRAARLRPARAPRRATSGRPRKANPGVRFIVYHSGYDIGDTQEPYRGDANGRLEHEHGRRADQEPAREQLRRDAVHRRRARRSATCPTSGPSSARCGASVMNDPDQAAHLLGKLITYVGPEADRWGTDSLWYGSPQAEIVGAAPVRVHRARARSCTACRTGSRATSRTRRAGADARSARSATGSSAATRRAAYEIDPDAAPQRDRTATTVNELRDDGYLRGVGHADARRRRWRPTAARPAHPPRGDRSRCVERPWSP